LRPRSGFGPQTRPQEEEVVMGGTIRSVRKPQEMEGIHESHEMGRLKPFVSLRLLYP
jgi:hypothetical protein